MIKIGEISRIMDISIQTIRYYEKEGLISPIEVDRWTGYRYYDESSVDRLSEILYLKDLGFSLKQIKNFNEQTLKEKAKEIEKDIKKLRQNLIVISSMTNEKGEIKMKKFINDESVVGKYTKIGIVKEIEDFNKNKMVDEKIFNFDELYFLPQGKPYWVFSWTKDILYLKERELPYKLIGDKLFIGVRDHKTNQIDNYAVYQKVDNKEYTINDIRIKDDTNIPFISDAKVVGFWEVYDYIIKPEDLNPDKKTWGGDDFYLKEYIFKSNGELLVKVQDEKDYLIKRYSKNYIINENNSTVCEYQIKTVNNQDYLIMEWKSGDYIFGGKIYGYYVFKKIK